MEIKFEIPTPSTLTSAFIRSLQERAKKQTIAEALLTPEVSAIVRLITSAVVRQRVEVFKNGSPLTPNDPVASFFEEPIPGITFRQFLEVLVAEKVLFGERFVMFKGENLWLIPPTAIQREINPHTGRVSAYLYYSPNNSESPIKISPNDVIVDYTPDPRNPLRPFPQTSASLRLVDLVNNALSYLASFFENATIPTGLLVIKGASAITDYKASEKIKKRLETYLSDNWQGKHNAFRIIPVEEDVEFKPLSTPIPLDAFTKLIEFLRKEICAVFNVPPALLGYENAPKASLETARLHFHREVIIPEIESLEEFLTRVVNEYAKRRNIPAVYKVVISRPPTEDEEVILQKIKLGILSGALTLNEIREMLGFPAHPEGNRLVKPLNAPDDNTVNPTPQDKGTSTE